MIHKHETRFQSFRGYQRENLIPPTLVSSLLRASIHVCHESINSIDRSLSPHITKIAVSIKKDLLLGLLNSHPNYLHLHKYDGQRFEKLIHYGRSLRGCNRKTKVTDIRRLRGQTAYILMRRRQHHAWLLWSASSVLLNLGWRVLPTTVQEAITNNYVTDYRLKATVREERS